MSTATTPLAKSIERIEKLRVRTMHRAASEPEEQAAALAIGRIVMRNPGLVITDEVVRPPQRPTPRRREPDVVELCDVRFMRETPKAVLVSHEGRRFWLPKSQIIAFDWDDMTATVTKWIWAQKQRETAA